MGYSVRSLLCPGRGACFLLRRETQTIDTLPENCILSNKLIRTKRCAGAGLPHATAGKKDRSWIEHALQFFVD